MREFYIDDDGIKLHAKLDMPAGISDEDAESGKAKCPLVIVIHGLTGHMEERHIVAVAELFNSMGFATLRAEMYGHGKSGGRFREHNLFKWINNAMTVTDYARSLDFVTDLYVCGHSQGGAATMFLAGIEPDLFKAAIPMSPAAMITSGARNGREFGFDFDPAHLPDELPVAKGMYVSSNYVRAAQLLDMDWAISAYKGPVLIVYGDNDEAIPMNCVQEAASRYSDAKFAVIPGDDHCYNYHLDQVLDAIKEFMSQFLQ